MKSKLFCDLTSLRAALAELSTRPRPVNSPALEAAVTEIGRRLGNVDRLAQIQTDPLKPKTLARDEALAAAHAAALVIGSRASSYAHVL